MSCAQASVRQLHKPGLTEASAIAQDTHTPCTHRAHTVHTHTHHIMPVSSLASGQDRCAHTFGVEQSGRRAVVGSAFGHASQRAVHSARFVIWHRRALWACLCRTASRARVHSAAESALTVVSAEARLLRLRTVLDEGVCLSRRGLEQREQQSPQQRHRDSPAHQPPCPFSLLSLFLSLSLSLCSCRIALWVASCARCVCAVLAGSATALAVLYWCAPALRSCFAPAREASVSVGAESRASGRSERLAACVHVIHTYDIEPYR